MKVYFSHGKESGPWGSKIRRLAATAQAHGLAVESIDYSDILDPEQRASRLLAHLKAAPSEFVLVGSSMGGYVSLTAAEQCQQNKPKGIFLLAPALYIPGYQQQTFLGLPNVEIVHGWSDEVIPYQNSVRYAQSIQCTLHLLDGDHRLNTALEHINGLFELFLTDLK